MMTGRESVLLAARIHGMTRSEARSGPPSCSTASTLTDAPTAAPRPTPAACCASSTSPWAWSPGQPCSSSTSPRPASTPRPARRCGTRSPGWLPSRQLTVLLTTHYLDEADRLADRLAIVDHGRLVVEGTPDELKRGSTATASSWRSSTTAGRHCGGTAFAPRRRSTTSPTRVASSGPGPIGRRRHPGRPGALDRPASEVDSATVSRPSLDDVYLHYAGRTFDVGRRRTVTALVSHSALLARRSTGLVRQPAYVGITLIQPMIWLLLFGQLFSRVAVAARRLPRPLCRVPAARRSS